MTSRVRIGSVTLALDDVGEGAPLLLVHGFPLSRRMWAAQCGALHGAWRCLAPDLRGFGESDAAPPFSMDRWADDLAELLDRTGARERVVLCGLSMGGYVAFAFWRRHRERVRALVLADTRPDADTPEGIARRHRTIEVARERGSASVATLLQDGMLGATTRERRPEVAALLRAMITATPVEGIIGASEAMMARPDSTDLLGTIDVPTLIVVGEEDAVTPPEVARTMHAAIPGSRLEVVPRAGHLTPLERPAAFNCILGDWLDTLED